MTTASANLGASGGTSLRVRIDAAGRVVIPVAVRKALGIGNDQELVLSLGADRIMLRTVEGARAQVKDIARAHRKECGSVVDAFLAARRAEAATEL